MTFFRCSESSESYSTAGCDDADAAAVGTTGNNEVAVGTNATDDTSWVGRTVDDPNDDYVVCRCRFGAGADNNALRAESIKVD